MSAASSTADRDRELDRAGWNIFNLDPRAIDVDLLTDVPSEPAPILTARARAAEADGRPPPAAGELAELAAAMVGPARMLFFTKGRAAETALAAALLAPGAVVLSNGLFRTTRHAIEGRGAVVETSPPGPPGSSAVDLGWAQGRMASGRVAAIHVELAANARCGWPLSLEHARALRALCDERGVLFLVDATRGLANARALGVDGPAGLRAVTELADAFTVSCAKEFLVAGGSLLAVRDLEAQRAAYTHGFEAGTLLESAPSRRLLAEGLRELAADPAWIDRRAAQLALLAGELGRLGVPVARPPGAHAVFVDIDPSVAADANGSRALEALLFREGGVRAMVQDTPSGGRAARLAVGLGRHEDAALRRAAAGVAAWHRRAAAGEVPLLVPAPSEALYEAFGHYAPARAPAQVPAE
jgi:tryptophanase